MSDLVLKKAAYYLRLTLNKNTQIRSKKGEKYENIHDTKAGIL
jgi:hypothetical protein